MSEMLNTNTTLITLKLRGKEEGKKGEYKKQKTRNVY